MPLIFMCKLEADVVTPVNLPFYNRYVDDCCTKRKANAPDILLENLNSYHPNIKFTVGGKHGSLPGHRLYPSRWKFYHLSPPKTRETTSTLEIGHPT